MLSVRAILEMAHFARNVLEGKRSPEEFFRYWPDLNLEEEKDVIELWYQMQYFENDIVHDPEGAEYYRMTIAEFAGKIENRFEVKWDTKEG